MQHAGFTITTPLSNVILTCHHLNVTVILSFIVMKQNSCTRSQCFMFCFLTEKKSLTDVAYFSRANSAVTSAGLKSSHQSCLYRCRQRLNESKVGLASIAIMFVLCLCDGK